MKTPAVGINTLPGGIFIQPSLRIIIRVEREGNQPQLPLKGFVITYGFLNSQQLSRHLGTGVGAAGKHEGPDPDLPPKGIKVVQHREIHLGIV